MSDYFVHFQDSSKSPHLKSSHNLVQYLAAAKKHGFVIVQEYDQTENTMITLDYAKFFLERFIHPTIDYGISIAGYVNISLYDLKGRKVKQFIDSFHSPGYYSLTLSSKNLNSNIYILKLVSSNQVRTKKIAVVK